MKILITRPLHDFAIRQLRRKHKVEIHMGKVPMPKKLLHSRNRDKEGIICYPYDRIDEEVIGAGPKLRAIATYSVGYDHIDLAAAARRNIVVSYTPEVLTDATADLTMALMLDVFRRVGEGEWMIRGGRWKSIIGPDEFLGTDVHGKTLGILGMGRIGTAVAKRAQGFGMDILYNTRRRLPSRTERALRARYVT